ncbi:MAG: hypothetical protein WCJ64_21405 [Rhodospirillaceae bacterium]
MATAGQALDHFEGRVQAPNDELTQIGDAGAASLGSLAGGARQAAMPCRRWGAGGEAVRAVAAAAEDGMPRWVASLRPEDWRPAPWRHRLLR